MSTAAKGKKPYQLFKRNNSAMWYCRFSIAGQGQFHRSCETEDEDEAWDKARDIYTRAKIRGEQGQSVRERIFKDVAEEFLQKLEVDVESGELKKHVLTSDASSIKRYFIEFFGLKPIDCIKERDITRYIEWRKSYWTTGPGKNIETITYQRAGRSVTRPAAKDRTRTSQSRIRRELTVLKQVLKQAVKWGYLPSNLMPEFEIEKAPDNSRSGFTLEEYNRVIELAVSRHKETKEMSKLWHERLMVMAFVKLAGKSGMRPTELYNLNFGDIVGLKKASIEYKEKHDVRIRAHGKVEKSRTLVAKYEAVSTVRMLYAVWEGLFKKSPADTDPLFFNLDGSRLKSMSKGVNSLLSAAGLLHDRSGVKRTAYSFRHFYITQQLVHGVDVYLLAKNTGTSSDMIHRFYGHVEVEKMAKELRPEWDKPLA